MVTGQTYISNGSWFDADTPATFLGWHDEARGLAVMDGVRQGQPQEAVVVHATEFRE